MSVAAAIGGGDDKCPRRRLAVAGGDAIPGEPGGQARAPARPD
ncbi:MAG: hypothetical protein WAK28_12275 [Trebonia sp.]